MLGLELLVKLKGLEFKDVADYLSVSPQTVSDWIKGKRRVPPKRAVQLSEFFSIDENLISKKLTPEEESKIRYKLGEVYGIYSLRGNNANENYFSEGSDLDMGEVEQMSFDINIEDLRNTGTVKDLEDQIAEQRRELKTETLDISISELANMYSNRKAIDIHPEFQRLFRWTMTQKTKLIESIILGIPIPPLFVAEDERTAWDVIDGVQRLSTIFEFMGILRDEQEKNVVPSILVGTEKLPALEGKVWSNDHEGQEHRFSFKDGVGIENRFLNSKLKVIVVGNESNPNAKYDIFDRLNTGGSKLTYQEIRNCLAIMINRDFYVWQRNLSLNPDFTTCLPLSSKALNEQTDLEYVLRFVVYRHLQKEEYSFTDDINEVLTQKMRKICTDNDLDLEKEKEVFDKTFELLAESLGKDSFKKYYSDEKRFKGQVMLSNFEIIAIGIANNIEFISNLSNPIDYIVEKIKRLYESREYLEVQNIISGRAVTRFTTLTELGTEYFSS